MAPDPRLVFDIGMHKGEDSAFYLAAGYRVVAVEASEQLCERVRARFPAEIEDDRLTIVNAAIAERSEPVTFYASDVSVWGTTRPDWAQRNTVLGEASATTTVQGVTIGDLVEKYGTPHYMKVDIEGADMLCLEGFRGLEVPTFVSVESEKASGDGLVREFDVLAELGYTRFKVVAQQHVQRQKPAGLDYSFERHASGQFGDAAPGAWLSRSQAISKYRRIFARYAMFGDEGLVQKAFHPFNRSGAVRKASGLLNKYGAGWYDTHAAR